ncbi:MAG: Fur family transcriptional regulator [Armatimonadota bacterium]|nr:Fur family transcriptional regulator [Armatimonadota bacterium]MDR7448305.1 Fur family transcriptional regulator [Armatimonadota bacterium]MDR7459265.1 Fur family transcriptional regulator [Armatimonadota bacterium]MDR7478363.1 Fur family transcriptional regulator [Armatimonadota bacterium]MDR7487194.1 Fur family transcriptional regulator [Armatimonadota bacterium]
MLTAAELRERFQARGLRITPQRDLLFRLLEELEGTHPTAETLHLRAARVMPSISLRTVYAILEELAEVGAVRPLELGTGSKRFCTTVTRHHHLVCDRCGKVLDVFVNVGPVEIPPEQARGFCVTEQSLVFRGVCADCQRMAPSASAEPAARP